MSKLTPARRTPAASSTAKMKVIGQSISIIINPATNSAGLITGYRDVPARRKPRKTSTNLRRAGFAINSAGSTVDGRVINPVVFNPVRPEPVEGQRALKTSGSTGSPRTEQGTVSRRVDNSGHKVLLDSDLAALYGVATKVLLQAVKRNPERFPPDFMMQLTTKEWDSLRSQIVTLKTAGRGQHRKYLPYVFTEQGIAMLSSVLASKHAISVNIEIMRAFVRMRELLASNKELAKKLDELERKFSTHDQAIAAILSAIRQLTAPPEPKKRFIGFVELQERKR